ncbi:MAG TPA: hypothetical protein VJG32_08095 [Anaerolineae bacterium]|nr:hypothetical protein [Anaerolineae bacterium]
MKSALTCEECQSVLDVYVDEELSGAEVRQQYFAVWQHIQTCANCREDHELLYQILRHERDEDSAPTLTFPTRALTFLQVGGDAARWISRIRSRLAGDPFGLHITFNLDYLKSRLGLQPGLNPVRVFRSAESVSAPDSPFLIEDVPFEEQRLNIEITAIPDAEHPDWVTLQALLTGSGTLPDHLWAKLTWAGQTYSTPVNRVSPSEGEARIKEVSLAGIRDASEEGAAQFAIAFEVRDAYTDDDSLAE